MNLKDSIRRILREETEYVKDVRVKISDILKTNRDGQSLDDAIVNVQDGLKSYSEEPPFLLKIGDKYEVLDGFHRIAQKILDGKKYIISNVMIKESNMNLQESIRRILKEELNEVRVPRSERVELYKDNNIIVVVPLTHRALQKYANRCQWCINDDLSEWEDYHKGKHAVIIQRNPKKVKMGITGNPTASEILIISRWGGGGYTFNDVCDILGYEFENETQMSDYEVNLTNDINNFATNIVYYSPENGIYDMEDNFLWNYNYEISDIPNVTPEVIKIMDDYLEND